MWFDLVCLEKLRKTYPGPFGILVHYMFIVLPIYYSVPRKKKKSEKWRTQNKFKNLYLFNENCRETKESSADLNCWSISWIDYLLFPIESSCLFLNIMNTVTICLSVRSPGLCWFYLDTTFPSTSGTMQIVKQLV